MSTQPSRDLETFPNPRPAASSRCASTARSSPASARRPGSPDFATIRIRYVPDETCVELKSLKLYLWSYREVGAFHEAVTNQILDDLVTACQPKRMTIEGDFMVRGGIHTVVEVTHEKG